MRRLLTAASIVALALPVATAQARERWDTRVLSLIPSPGFPANAYPSPDGRFVYEGTYANSSSTAPSRVFELDAERGTILRSWTVRGQALDGSQGVQVATTTADDELLLLDKNPPRVLRLDKRTGAQTEYAYFPPGEGALPNHAVWGPDGSLYITDYEHPVLWRVPPGGGRAERWLTDERLSGGPFGTTGIALRADRRTLVVGMQSQLNGAGSNPSTGRLFELPIGDDGRPGPLKQLWESAGFDAPDAFGIARSGRIYVALLLANQIAVIAPDGTEVERFGPSNSSTVPFDNPSSARFLGSRVVVANQSFVNGDPTRQAVLDVETGEPGLPELIPPGAGRKDAVAPKLAARFVRRALRVSLDEAATVAVTVARGGRVVRRTRLELPAGITTRTLTALARAKRSPRRGRWTVTLTATDASRNAAAPVTAVVRVR